MLILIFFAFCSSAAIPDMDMKVQSPSVNFTVTIKKGKFEYVSSQKTIRREITKCNSRAFERFAAKLRGAVNKELIKAKPGTPGGFEITLNKEKFTLAPLSRGGVKLLKAETDVDYVISEAIYRCSKK